MGKKVRGNHSKNEEIISFSWGIYMNMKFSEIIKLNEGAVNMNVELTPEQFKKAKNIYQIFKTGRFVVYDIKIKYILPDDFYVDLDSVRNRVLVLPVNSLDEVQKSIPLKLYMVKDNEDLYIKQDQVNNSVYKTLTKKIEEKFKKFGIIIIF